MTNYTICMEWAGFFNGLLNFSCQVESNGWFSAIKLIARIQNPASCGHL